MLYQWVYETTVHGRKYWKFDTSCSLNNNHKKIPLSKKTWMTKGLPTSITTKNETTEWSKQFGFDNQYVYVKNKRKLKIRKDNDKK